MAGIAFLRLSMFSREPAPSHVPNIAPTQSPLPHQSPTRPHQSCIDALSVQPTSGAGAVGPGAALCQGAAPELARLRPRFGSSLTRVGSAFRRQRAPPLFHFCLYLCVAEWAATAGVCAKSPKVFVV